MQDDAMIQKLVDWGKGREDVRAMVLTSTRTRPGFKVDRLSDYDVVVAVRDITPYFDSIDWLGDFGTLLVRYRDPIRTQLGFRRFASITQYEDTLKIDFSLVELGLLPAIAALPTLPDEFDVGYAILLDKDDLTANLQPPTYQAHIPTPPDQATFTNAITECFHEATYVAKHLWRDDLMAAKFNLDYRMRHVWLRTMLEWHMSIDHDWSMKAGTYGRGLKKQVRPDIWAAVESSYAGETIDDNWRSLFETINLFGQVAREVGAALNLDYPQVLEDRVVAYLKRVKELPESD